MTDQDKLLQDLEASYRQMETEALSALAGVQDEEALHTWQVAHIGRNSPVMNSFKRMADLPKELRPLIGQRANQVKEALESAYEARREQLKQQALQRSLEQERLDVTLPGRRPPAGRLHPITQTLRQILSIFATMGFQVYLSRDVETDDFNFTYLNIPPHHPARDIWDTFHLEIPNTVLRTHTSPGQIRAMREFAPEPVRVALPGMVYRYEQISTRSSFQFYQIELLAVGKNITFGDLKGTLNDFVYRLFEKEGGPQEIRTRFRPDYFPFTEPSAEMDVECFICGGKGCSVCKQSGWVEILGCGMVHPVVLRNGGYDPKKFTGFAAGLGVDRLCMLQHGIDDIRNFWRNDVRFLEQF